MTWHLSMRLLMALLAFGIAVNAAVYLVQSPDTFSFAEQRTTYEGLVPWLYMHIIGGFLALTCGAPQFFPSLRFKGSVHRWLGRCYVGAVCLGAFASIPLALSAFGGVSNLVGFATLAVLWIYTTLMGLRCARRRDFFGHRVWMIRSYALSFAAVTLRAELGILIGVFGLSLQEAYLIVPWTSWVLNLIVAEWWLVRQSSPLPT